MSDPTSRVEAFSISHAQICDGVQSFRDLLINSAALGLDIYGVNQASLAADVGNYENVGDDKVLSRWDWINKGDLTVQGGYLSFPLASTLSGSALAQTTLTNVSEIQTQTPNGATAGNFTLTFRGATTAPIAWNATSAIVQTALQALSTVGTNVTVTGGPAQTTALVYTFTGTLASQAVPLIVATLTGLTTPTGGTISRTTVGSTAGVEYGLDLWHEDSINAAPKPIMLVLPSRDETGLTRRLIIGLHKCAVGPIGFDGPAYKDGFKVNYTATALMSPVDERGLPFADGKSRIGRLLSVA